MPFNSNPGRKSLSEISGEETRTLKILITESQYDFLMQQEPSAASFIRYLISAAMEARKMRDAGMKISDIPAEQLMHQAQEIQKKLDILLGDEDSELVDRARKAQELWDEMQDELKNSE